jgi:tetraether lipid synthase
VVLPAAVYEVYLQFDSFERHALMTLRGGDLRDIRTRALERLNRLGVSTTLVVTLKKGDHEIGRIIDFALEQPAVRGVTFQPIQAAGRLEQFDPATDRLTLTEVRRKILEQTSVFRPEDLLPVPCHLRRAMRISGKPRHASAGLALAASSGSNARTAGRLTPCWRR